MTEFAEKGASLPEAIELIFVGPLLTAPSHQGVDLSRRETRALLVPWRPTGPVPSLDTWGRLSMSPWMATLPPVCLMEADFWDLPSRLGLCFLLLVKPKTPSVIFHLFKKDVVHGISWLGRHRWLSVAWVDTFPPPNVFQLVSWDPGVVEKGKFLASLYPFDSVPSFYTRASARVFVRPQPRSSACSGFR